MRIILFLAYVLLLVGQSFAGEVYKYIDENGNICFTDDPAKAERFKGQLYMQTDDSKQTRRARPAGQLSPDQENVIRKYGPPHGRATMANGDEVWSYTILAGGTSITKTYTFDRDGVLKGK